MSDEIIGSKIQSYRVVRQIGRGGMGNVYEARHEQIDRRAAIKVLHPEHARDAEMAQRFFNEARAANVVGHPGLVNIYELGSLESGAAFIIMEYLEGETLRQRIRRPEGMFAADALRIARQIAGALQAVHAKGIIHRDLKPDNIILVSDAEVSGGERAKVLDFGIAKLLHGSESGRGPTHTGAVVGTPAYMAPEQCGMRMPISDRTDVYALGVMLYEMLAAKPPFVGEGPTALIGQHLFVDPPPLPEFVAADTAALVMRMLAKAPADRPNMADVVSTLSNLGDFSRISRLDIPVPPLVVVSPSLMSSSQALMNALPSLSTGSQSALNALPALSTGSHSSGATTIGQSTGERVPAPPSPPRRTTPLLAAGIAMLLVASSSSVLWILFGNHPPRPGTTVPKVEALQTTAPLQSLSAGPATNPNTATGTPVGTVFNDPPVEPGTPAVAPTVAEPTAAQSAASCQSAFAHKHYVDAIAACNQALAKNPNQPGLRTTLRSAVARLSSSQRSRPLALPRLAPEPPATHPEPVAPRPVPVTPPTPPATPTAPPAVPVKAHYEKVKPID